MTDHQEPSHIASKVFDISMRGFKPVNVSGKLTSNRRGAGIFRCRAVQHARYLIHRYMAHPPCDAVTTRGIALSLGGESKSY